MRLLFLNHNVYREGGTYFRAFHAARHLVRLGHEVTLVTISKTKRWGFDTAITEGVQIIMSPDLLWGVGRTGWDLWDTLARISFLHRTTWDIIHAWDCRPVVILPALYAAYLSRKNGGKLVIDWCDWWGRGGTQAERPANVLNKTIAPIETFFEETFRQRAQGTTVASRALRDRVIQLGVAPESIMLLPGGSDFKAIQPIDVCVARRTLNLPIEACIVGYLGALAYREVELLLEAFELFRRQYSNARLLAIGLNVAGAKLSFRGAAKARWSDAIIETGRVPFESVGMYLGACNILILPMRDTLSNQARWPSKINDYLAAQRPIVATNVGEVAALFLRHPAGLLTHPDASSLADGLRLVTENGELAFNFSQAARKLAEGELSWDTLADQLDAFYGTLSKAR